MHTHVIILAQGRQERMGDSTGGLPKQLLPLPGCANAPILQRTLRQLAHLLWGAPGSVMLEEAARRAAAAPMTLVAWPEIFAAIKDREISVEYLRHPSGGSASLVMLPEVVSLADPGNSSLKGIYRYLEAQALIAGAPRPDRTIVLLGDVVYSWACLEAIFADLALTSRRFVGTADISPSGGEIWGVAWTRADNDIMIAALESALAKHPPYADTYQPGQLRRFMWSLHPSFQTTSRYAAIDDYTNDIDVPSDLLLLPSLSEAAANDDRVHGMTW